MSLVHLIGILVCLGTVLSAPRFSQAIDASVMAKAAGLVKSAQKLRQVKRGKPELRPFHAKLPDYLDPAPFALRPMSVEQISKDVELDRLDLTGWDLFTIKLAAVRSLAILYESQHPTGNYLSLPVERMRRELWSCVEKQLHVFKSWERVYSYDKVFGPFDRLQVRISRDTIVDNPYPHQVRITPDPKYIERPVRRPPLEFVIRVNLRGECALTRDVGDIQRTVNKKGAEVFGALTAAEQPAEGRFF